MTVFFYGRLWDAPMTDEATHKDLAGRTCVLCDEPIVEGDDAMQTGQTFHTECHLRMALGDVAHLEGRCLCNGGSDHDTEGTYREQSKRALEWLVAHGRGRWRTP